MFSWIIFLLLFFISLLILIKAADVFVENLVEIGRSLGISQLYWALRWLLLELHCPNLDQQ